MEALRFDPKTKELTFEKIPVPKIENDDDVIVEVAYCGICGTDLHILKGEFPSSPVKYTPGHEYSGIVRAIGSAVTNVKVGDRVSCDPQRWCTTCDYCRTARYHHCVEGGVENATGIRHDGGFAQFSKVKSRVVYKLPDNISLKQGALTEPISCIIWGLNRSFLPAPIGAKILLTGAGIIGNLWSAVLHHLGYRSVIVVEPSDARRKLNQRMGTGFEVMTPDELNLKIKNENYAADIAIDCSGNAKAIEQAIAALNYQGKLQIFGVAPPQARISISPFDIFRKELTVVGSIINPWSFPPALGIMEAMGDRYLDYYKLGIEEFKMKDVQKALGVLEKATAAKAVFAINSNLE
ncbi:Sorbitol dehydrogenase [Nesidiocoris tenuis]|uniref:Sorbitol dehydrogenase n=1 Tax=Nesidiocoris tenuis TaxID=355587 RepID=A0ABN7B856_9HEMI|nr:Sorbitol dehydrogenase [Nesidiocoris tenuis]